MSAILPFCLAHAIEIYQIHRIQDSGFRIQDSGFRIRSAPPSAGGWEGAEYRLPWRHTPMCDGDGSRRGM